MISTVKLKFIQNRPTQQALKKFFSDRRYSGVTHGDINSIRYVDQEGALIDFKYSEDAEKVAETRTYTWSDGTQIEVALHNEMRTENNDETERTITLEADSVIPEELVRLYFKGEINVDTSKSSSFHAIVKLNSQNDAQEWLEKGQTEILGISVKIEKIKRRGELSPAQSEVDNSRTVRVSGVDPKWDKDMLTRLFEMKGGPIQDLKMDNIANGQIEIVFKDSNTTDKVLQQHPIEFVNRTLSISQLGDNITRTVQVLDIKEKDENIVKIFFANKVASGGGPILHFCFDENKGEAIITFDNISDATNVLSQNGLDMGGDKVRVIPLDDTYVTDRTCAITVTGNILTEFALTMHFLNEGGIIKDCFINNDSSAAFITFEDPEVVDNIMRTETHVIKQEIVNVERMNPADPPPIVMPPNEPATLIMNQVSTSVTKTDLQKFIKSVSDKSLQYISFSVTKPGTVLLEFNDEPDVDKIKQKTIQQPLKDTMVNVQLVPKSSKLQIHNIKDYSIDDLKRFIDKFTSCTEYRFDKQTGQYVIVHLHDIDVREVVKVLAVKNKDLHIKIYHDCFGIDPLSSLETVPQTWFNMGETSYEMDQYEQNEIPSSCVLIEGVDSSIHRDTLLSYLGDEEFVGEKADIDRIDIGPKGSERVIVKYKDSKAASALLKKTRTKIDGFLVKVSPYEMKDETGVTLDSSLAEINNKNIKRTVIVEGIIPSWKQDGIRMFLKRPDNGGPIEILETHPYDKNVIFITFGDQGDAERIRRKGVLSYRNERIYVRQYHPDEPVNTLKITGIPQDTSQSFLSLFFEDKVESGGGKVDEIKYNQHGREAIIRFFSSADAQSVLQKEGLRIKEEAVHVQALDDTYTPNKVCAIQVSGLSEKLEQQLLKMYFNNREKSGGGKIKRSHFNTDNATAVFTFENAEVPKRIIQQPNHCLDNVMLNVQALAPADLPPLIQTCTQPTSLMFHNLPWDITADILTDYLQDVAKSTIVDIHFSWENQGVAEIVFVTIPDFYSIRDKIQREPILDKMCSVQRIPRPKCLQIFNASSLTEGHLTHLLGGDQNARTDEITVTKYSKPREHFIVEFQDVTDLDGKLEELRAKHPKSINATYEKAFGVVPPGVSLKTPVVIPEDVEIEQPSKHIAEFIQRSTAAVDRANRELESINGIIKWPNFVHEKIVVTYNASQSADKNWATNVKKIFQNFICDFTEHKIRILHALWQEFKKQYIPKDTDTVAFLKDDRTCDVTLVGLKSDVDEIYADLIQKKIQMENDHNMRNTITTEKRELPKLDIVLLQKNQFADNLANISKDMNVNFNIDGGVIEITDLPDNIGRAFEEMELMLKNVVRKDIQFSPKLLSIMKTKKTEKLLEELIIGKCKSVYWEVATNCVIIYALSNSDLAETEHIFRNKLQERTIKLPPAEMKVLKSDQGELFLTKEQMKSSETMDWSIADSSITITGTAERVNNWYEGFEQLLKENLIQEKFVSVPVLGAVRLVAQKIENIRRQFPDAYCVIDPVTEGHKTGFLIKGVRLTCTNVEAKITEILHSIKTLEMPTKQPGIKEYFTQKMGKHILSALETKHGVTVNVANDTKLQIPSTNDATANGKPLIKTTVRKCHTTIIVAQADLPSFVCDAIVNAANDMLDHEGGLAGAIVKKGGREIQEECHKYVRSKGSLVSPDVYVSKAGKLKCKAIIHAVGPKWNGGSDNEENTLYECIYAVLQAAKQHNFESIALPAISTGIFRFPLDLALKTILDAIADFCEKDGASGIPSKIHLVDFTDNVTNDMQIAVEEKFEASNATPKPGISNKRMLVNPKRGPNGELIINVRGKTEITVLQGDITHDTSDAIVNGSDSNLSLSGLLGTVLNNKAGKMFQDDCRSKGSIKNLVQFTSAGDLPCKHIIHVDVGGKMTPIKWNEVILSSLKMATSKSLTSIAFPAMGTGNLGESPVKMAEIFIRAFTEYLKKTLTSIKRIRLVVLDTGMADTFKDTMESFIMKEYRDDHATKEQEIEKMTLVIYGDSDSVVEKVKSELHGIIASQIEVVTIGSQADQTNIAKLSSEQIDEIMTQASFNKVDVQIKDGQRQKSITIRGEKTGVQNVRKYIEEIFKEFKDKEYETILATKVQWKYKENGVFKPYPANINVLIEEAYKSNKAYAEWEEQDDTKLRVIFKDEREVTIGSTDPPVAVMRIEHETVRLPDTWTAMGEKENVKEEVLNPNSKEYIKVADEFNKQTNNRYKIDEITRIQNQSLYRQVKIKEKEIKTTATTKPISRMLWHGTSKDTIPHINTTGLNRNYCGLNATYYGKGVYFAGDAEYSCRDTYSKPDLQGYKYVYYCNVLTGDYTNGHPSMIDAPPKDVKTPHIKYDSVVDSLGNMEMFIVFHDAQAYPEYLIKIKAN